MMLAACTTTTTHPHIRRGWQTGIGCCDRLTFQQFHSIELPPLLPSLPLRLVVVVVFLLLILLTIITACAATATSAPAVIANAYSITLSAVTSAACIAPRAVASGGSWPIPFQGDPRVLGQDGRDRDPNFNALGSGFGIGTD